MSISPYFEDETIVNQLRTFYDVEEQWSIDFQSLLSQIEELDDDYLQLRIQNRVFTIHNELGIVEEVSGEDDELE